MDCVIANEGESLFHNVQLKAISHADLRREDIARDDETAPTIHQSFAGKIRARKLRRKRLAARTTSPFNEESTETEMDIAQSLNTHGDTSQSMEVHQLPPTVPDTEQPETVQPSSNISPSTSDELPEVDIQQSTATENPPTSDIERDEAVTVQPRTSSCNSDQVPEDILEQSTANPSTTHIGEKISSSGEALSILQMAQYSPASGWILNNKRYMEKVAVIIKYGHNSVTKARVHSFLERLRKAELKRTKQEHDFWTKADPEIDAWMIMTGRQREVFDVSIFVKQNPEILPHLKSKSRRSKCPSSYESLPYCKGDSKTDAERGCETREEEEEDVPSQTYDIEL